MQKARSLFILACLVCSRPHGLLASSGTEGASFLDIPVGARPAAMGSAYSALADDAYAPTWNPAGLGKPTGDSVATQYLDYLDSIHYEYLSFVHPLTHRQSWGTSIQYLGTGDIPGADASGNDTGSFSSHYAAYTLSYGQSLSEKMAWGLSGKWINAQISDVSANAFAFDLGSLYAVTPHLTLAGTVMNVGTKLNFLDSPDSLPLAAHVGGAYQWPGWTLSMEGVYPQTELASFHAGLEWKPLPEIALRGGYRTDTAYHVAAAAGITLGFGIKLRGQEFSYAWLPMGDLGNTQYFSLVLRFGGEKAKRSLIQLPTDSPSVGTLNNSDPDFDDLIKLLNGSVQEAKPPQNQNPSEY